MRHPSSLPSSLCVPAAGGERTWTVADSESPSGASACSVIEGRRPGTGSSGGVTSDGPSTPATDGVSTMILASPATTPSFTTIVGGQPLSIEAIGAETSAAVNQGVTQDNESGKVTEYKSGGSSSVDAMSPEATSATGAGDNSTGAKKSGERGGGGLSAAGNAFAPEEGHPGQQQQSTK